MAFPIKNWKNLCLKRRWNSCSGFILFVFPCFLQDYSRCLGSGRVILLTLFLTPGVKAATLTDELNVLMGTPAKGFFNQDYELKRILQDTGRADRYEAVKRLSLILFAVGGVLAMLIGNVYMVPIMGIGFSLAPIWYLRSTAASYKKHLNEELETAISIITTSYLRTEDLIRSVRENLPYINEPVRSQF